MSKLLTMTGRLTRQQYILMSFAVTAVTYAIAFVLGFVLGVAAASDASTVTVTFIITLAGSTVQAFIVVRRLHDLNKSGVHYWLLLLPLYNIYLSIVLLLQKGTAGPNQFGQDPATA